MKENGKGLVIAIIVLLVGAGVVPSISGVIETDRKEINEEKDTVVIENPISMDSIIGVEETVPSFDGGMTIVSIQPSAQDVEKGEWFDVGIYVEPSEPIIGVCVDVYFDPTLIQADWVFEGDLFPIIAHFYPGIIDNINGKITDIYIACLVEDTVSDPGYFVNISFTAQQKLGTSPLDMQNVEIYGIIELLPNTVIDGDVTVGEEPPQITNSTVITSDPLDTDAPYGWENVTCTVTDNIGVHMVKVVITYFDTAIYPMTRIPNTDIYYFNTTFTDSGYYKYYIWADDAEGNNATSSFQIFALPMNEDVNMDGCVTEDDLIIPLPPHEGTPGWIREDVNNNGCLDFGDILQIMMRMGECLPIPPWMVPPEIIDITLTTSDPLDTDIGWENFTCTVNLAVATVKLVVTNDTTTEEYPMDNIPGTDTYYYNTTFTVAGCYRYHIWVDDLSGNNATSTPEQFELPPNWDVDMNGQAHFGDLIDVIRMYAVYGPPGWVREDVDNNGQAHFGDLIDIIRRYGEWWK